MIWYILNLFIIFIFVCLFIIFRKSNKKWSKINDYLGVVSNTVNSVRYGNLSSKIQIKDPNDQNLSESINRMVETLNDREEMIIEYQGELTRQNKFLEAVINSLSDGILIVDEEGMILRITPQIVNWFGEDGRKLLNKNIFDYIKAPVNIKLDKLKNSEVFIKNNSQSIFSASAMKLVLDDKKKRLVVIIKDITSEHELDKLKEDFVATLTHDLKVPIVAEANILDFLIRGKFGEVSEKQTEAISNMIVCNVELLELVHILLETYRVNEKGIDLNKENVDLILFIKEIIDEMSPIVQKADLKINFEAEKDMFVDADRIQLRRVIKNLIQNAVSHSDTNKDIDVKLSRMPGVMAVSIIDHGKGIKKEDIEMVFEKYYSTAKKFRKTGTGLGLFLSQQIIKAHGGEIVVTSEENVNTEFCVKLPL